MGGCYTDRGIHLHSFGQVQCLGFVLLEFGSTGCGTGLVVLVVVVVVVVDAVQLVQRVLGQVQWLVG